MMRRRAFMTVIANQGGLTLPFTDNFTRGDGVIGGQWTGATWTVSNNTVINTPTLGADLVVNGGFVSDTVWSKGSGWTIGSGVATHAGAFSVITQNIATVGTWYQISYDVLNRLSGTFYGRIGGVNDVGRGADGSYVSTGRASSAASGGASNGAGDLDNIVKKPLTLTSLFATLPSTVANVIVQVVLATFPDSKQAGVVLNIDSTVNPLNFVVAYLDSSYFAKLDKCVNGIYTNVISGSITWNAAHNLKVVKSGDNYSLYYGVVGSEAQVGTTQAITGMNGTIHGLFSTHNSVKLDTFQLSANP